MLLEADDDELATVFLSTHVTAINYRVAMVRDEIAARNAIVRNPDIALVIWNWRLLDLEDLTLASEQAVPYALHR